MRLDFQLEMQQTQQLIMTPQLQQALKLLQLPALELDLYLEGQFLENPMLDLAEEDGEENPLPAAEDGPDLDWELYDSDWAGALGERKFPSFEEFTPCPRGGRQRLEQQLELSSLPPNLLGLCRYIIDSLGEDGYLRLSCQHISEQLGIGTEEVAAALAAVQRLEPTGIGARSLQECLLLQLDRRGDAPLFARAIIEGHLDLVAGGRIPVLAAALGAEYAQVQEAIDYIRSLEPRPGLGREEGGSAPYVFPDVALLPVGEKLFILVNDSFSNRLRLSPGYRDLLARAEPETQKYLQAKLASALWLLKAIEQRRTTLYRITEFIVEYQGAFFAQGPRALLPMRLKDVAQAIGVHESTVSRAVQGKYVQTPRGLLPYKYFFAANLETINGTGIANVGVKEILGTVIQEENKEEPLTDLEIARRLGERGIKISRRTVAKYRDELAIPGSALRRRW